MRIVTKDCRRDSRIVCGGARALTHMKNTAHRRARTRQRQTLRAMQRGDERDDFQARPITGWDVA